MYTGIGFPNSFLNDHVGSLEIYEYIYAVCFCHLGSERRIKISKISNEYIAAEKVILGMEVLVPPSPLKWHRCPLSERFGGLKCHRNSRRSVDGLF